MTKQWLVGAALIAAGTGAAFAGHGKGEGDGPGDHGPGITRMREEIGLSDQQVSELRTLWAERRKNAIRRRADMEVARVELRDLIEAATPDERAIAAKVKALSDLQAAGLRARVDGQLAVHKVLTPEQREKFREMRLKRPGPARRFGGRRGQGREDGPEGDEPDQGPHKGPVQ